MKLKFEIIPATALESGDIFYCTPDSELNEFGVDFVLTGTDQIFITDDYYDEDEDGNYAILVNGGWNIWFRPDEKVVLLAHYSDLIRVIEMVKEGNPDMELGPNDMLATMDQLRADYPSFDNDLLSKLNFDISNPDDDNINPDDDVELPF
jgi:hypothetical protein